MVFIKLEEVTLPLMLNFCLEEINLREDYSLELSGFLLGIHLFFLGLNSF